MEVTVKHNYNEAISILISQGKFHINLGLERISKLLELLGSPQDSLKVIHVAGTNGKGSTCAMLASILTESGYKTGLYTSPHLVDYTERIKINGLDISREDFARIIFDIVSLAEANNIPVTEFEILTAMAFVYFRERKTDFVILETGLGGRLDATNIIKNPLLSIITTIDFDHIDRLGNTIEKIAYEKAGIIKENIPVITLKDNNGIEIINKTAQERSCPIFLSNYSNYKFENNRIITESAEYETPLMGLWQLKNLSLVLKAVEFLSGHGINISQKAVESGIEKVKWQGRFQYIKEKSLILDGAHNLSGAKLLRDSLDLYFPGKKIIWIYSSLNTKDYESILKVIFKAQDIAIFTKSSSKSSVEPEILQEKAITNNLLSGIYSSNYLEEVLNLAFSLLNSENRQDNYLIVVAGSLYTVGEILSILKKQA